MLIRENTIDHNLLAPTSILHRSEKKKNIEKMRLNFPKPASGCNPRIRGGQIIKVTLISRNFLVKRQMLAGVADTNERTRENSQTRCKEFFISRKVRIANAKWGRRLPKGCLDPIQEFCLCFFFFLGEEY